MKKHTYPFQTIIPLSLVIIIDSFGLTLVFPVFAQLFSAHNTTFLPVSASVATHDLYFSLSILLYPLLMFFGAPFLGDLSDSLGRKAILLICLIGTLVGLLLSAIAVSQHLFGLLLFGRAIAGFTAGSQPVAQAAIVDVSDDSNTALNMAIMVFAITVGMVLGPVVGGMFSDSTLIKSFGFATPFWVASLLALINIIWLLFSFKETFIKQTKSFSVFRGLKLFFRGFSDSRIKVIAFFFLFFQVGWTMYYQIISFFLTNQLGFNSFKSGIFMGYLALLLSFSSVYLVKVFHRFFSTSRTTITCAFFVILGYLFSGIFYKSAINPWISGILIVLFNPIVYTHSLTFFSKAVDKDSQGWVMGLTGSINAFALALTAVLSGYLTYLNIALPFYVSAIAVTVSWILLMIFQKRIIQS